MKTTVVKILAAIPGIPLLMNAILFVVDPEKVTADFGMPLLVTKKQQGPYSDAALGAPRRSARLVAEPIADVRQAAARRGAEPAGRRRREEQRRMRGFYQHSTVLMNTKHAISQ